MMKTASVLSLIVLFSIGSLALFYYERESPSSAEEGESEEDPKELVLNDEQINQGGLQFASVGREEVYQYIPVQGRLVIRPDRHAHLIARSSGIVKSAEKNIGDRVSQ